jgi:hypothetical protein
MSAVRPVRNTCDHAQEAADLRPLPVRWTRQDRCTYTGNGRSQTCRYDEWIQNLPVWQNPA